MNLSEIERSVSGVKFRSLGLTDIIARCNSFESFCFFKNVLKEVSASVNIVKSFFVNILYLLSVFFRQYNTEKWGCKEKGERYGEEKKKAPGRSLGKVI